MNSHRTDDQANDHEGPRQDRGQFVVCHGDGQGYGRKHIDARKPQLHRAILSAPDTNLSDQNGDEDNEGYRKYQGS